jgi:hypothetical protein
VDRNIVDIRLRRILDDQMKMFLRRGGPRMVISKKEWIEVRKNEGG